MYFKIYKLKYKTLPKYNFKLAFQFFIAAQE